MDGKITGRLGSSMSVTSKFGKATPYIPLDRPTARNDGGVTSTHRRTMQSTYSLESGYPETVSLKRLIASMCWSGPFKPARIVFTER